MSTLLATFAAATVTSDADVSAVCGALADIATAARLKAAHAALVAESEASVSEVSARMTKDDAAALLAAITPRPLAEWHEDDGVVLWWRFPVNEPPYVGTPLDDDWPVMATATGGTTNYATHWTRLLIPEAPR